MLIHVSFTHLFFNHQIILLPINHQLVFTDDCQIAGLPHISGIISHRFNLLNCMWLEVITIIIYSIILKHQSICLWLYITFHWLNVNNNSTPCCYIYPVLQTGLFYNEMPHNMLVVDTVVQYYRKDSWPLFLFFFIRRLLYIKWCQRRWMVVIGCLKSYLLCKARFVNCKRPRMLEFCLKFSCFTYSWTESHVSLIKVILV